MKEKIKEFLCIIIIILFACVMFFGIKQSIKREEELTEAKVDNIIRTYKDKQVTIYTSYNIGIIGGISGRTGITGELLDIIKVDYEYFVKIKVGQGLILSIQLCKIDKIE